MKITTGLLIFLLCCYNINSIGGELLHQKAYQWKYHTTAHQMLLLEEQNANLPEVTKRKKFDTMYAIVDRLIDAAKLRLRPLIKSSSNYSPIDAKIILKTIDSLLAEQYFIVCITVNMLSEGLTPHRLDDFPCYKYLVGYRQEFCFKHPLALYYGVDCDLGALLYCSVGEIFNFPIKLVEVPTHNFVRWRFDDKSYLNYDNNSGGIYSDDDFRYGRSPTASTTFTADEEYRCHFLTDMDAARVKGYYLSIIAIEISHEGRYAEAAALYKESIAARPWDVLAMNNLSWMYLTIPQFNNKKNYEEAFRLSKIVDKNLPSSIEYRDTFSCACAGVGDFKKALEVEKSARNKPRRIQGYAKRMTCLQLDETIW